MFLFFFFSIRFNIQFFNVQCQSVCALRAKIVIRLLHAWLGKKIVRATTRNDGLLCMSIKRMKKRDRCCARAGFWSLSRFSENLSVFSSPLNKCHRSNFVSIGNSREHERAIPPIHTYTHERWSFFFRSPTSLRIVRRVASSLPSNGINYSTPRAGIGKITLWKRNDVCDKFRDNQRGGVCQLAVRQVTKCFAALRTTECNRCHLLRCVP